MLHIAPLNREDLNSIEPVLAMSENMMGFVPNSMLTMAHMPQLTVALSMLASTAFGADLKATIAMYSEVVPVDEHASEALPPDLVQLIAFCVSVSAGCRYCQAHTSHNAHRFGIAEAKLNAVLANENSDLFTDAEPAVINLALAAGQVPNDSTSEHFQVLKRHFTDRQVVQIVGVIPLFGFLNRWNDTMVTDLESLPREFATGALADSKWQVGKHG